MSTSTVFYNDAKWKIPIGSVGYTQFKVNTAQACGFVIGGAGGIMQANWYEKACLLLIYLSQVWQYTAGLCLFSNTQTYSAVSGNGAKPSTNGYLRFVQLSFSNSGQFRRSIGGTNRAKQLGWLQFTWGTFAGKLHRIDFTQSVIFPESDGANGFNFWLVPDAVADMTLCTYDPSTAGVDIGNGTESNALSDLTISLPSPSFSFVTGAATDNPAVSVPVIQSGLLKDVALGNQPERSVVGLASETDYVLWMWLLALASEAWNATAGAIYGDTDQPPLTVTSEYYHEFAAAMVRNVRITVNGPVPTGRRYQYSGDFPIYGYVAKVSQGFLYDLQYLNAETTHVAAGSLLTTGLWVLPFPGVSLNVVVGTAADVVKSMFTVQGEVNLVRGKIDGLVGLG